jgi:hypothetical protein
MRQLLIKREIDGATDTQCGTCPNLDRGNDRCWLFAEELGGLLVTHGGGAGDQTYERHADCLEAEARAK